MSVFPESLFLGRMEFVGRPLAGLGPPLPNRRYTATAKLVIWQDLVG